MYNTKNDFYIKYDVIMHTFDFVSHASQHIGTNLLDARGPASQGS